MKNDDVSTVEAEVLDAKGCPITKRSIVGMSEEDGHWSKYQDLVVDPDSKQDDEYTVAVFFNLEVNHSEFWCRAYNGKLMNISDWDKKYGADCKKGDVHILQHENILEICPRIILFKPEELVVQPDWSLETLASRLFHQYHSLYRLKFKQPVEDFMCFLGGCQNRAKKLVLYNSWGTVTSHYVCEECFKTVNGIHGDCPPKERRPILLSDGSPAPRPS